jgi:hypothetical protein
MTETVVWSTIIKVQSEIARYIFAIRNRSVDLRVLYNFDC